MTTLINRASLPQRRIYRIIDGAVRQAAKAHPENKITPLFAGQVAKRGAGTLAAAAWPSSAFAAPKGAVNDGAVLTIGKTAPAPSGQAGRRSASRSGLSSGRGPHQPQVRPPLARLHTRVGRMIANAKRAGNQDVAATLIEVARLIRRELDATRPPNHADPYDRLENYQTGAKNVQPDGASVQSMPDVEEQNRQRRPA